MLDDCITCVAKIKVQKYFKVIKYFKRVFVFVFKIHPWYEYLYLYFVFHIFEVFVFVFKYFPKYLTLSLVLRLLCTL